MKFWIYATAVLLSAAILTGCSGGTDSPVLPGSDLTQGLDLTDGSIKAGQDSTHPALWGYWDVRIDTTSWEVELIPVRGIQYTVDVVQFMQPPLGPAGSLGILILDTTQWLSEGFLPVEVGLTHPFPGLDQYTGSDVRGLFITEGSVSLNQDTNLLLSDRGTEHPWLSNPDGHSRWMNPEEFRTDGTIFTYFPGQLGNDGVFSATLNAYKLFADDLDSDVALYDFFTDPANLANRSQFTASTTNKRIYDLYFPIIGDVPEINFQYAVLASWAEPVDLDPGDLPGSFPVEANAQEAFLVDVVDNGTLYYTSTEAGGDILLDLEIFDWAPFVNGTGSVIDEIEKIIIESPQGILPSGFVEFDQSTLAATALPGNTDASSIVSIEILGCLPVELEGQEVIITVEHSGGVGYDNYGAGSNYPDAPLASYFFHTLSVSSIIPQSDLPVVTAIDPDHGVPDTYLYDVIITGEKLTGVTEVKLVGDSQETVVENMLVVDDTTITCELDLAGLSLGLYDVTAIDPDDGEGSLEDGFEVMDCPTGVQDEMDIYTTSQEYSPLFVAGLLTDGTDAGDVITQWGHAAWTRLDVADPPADGTPSVYWAAKPSISNIYYDWSWSMDMDPVNDIFAYTTFDDDDDSGSWPDTSFDFVKICEQEDGSYVGAIDTECGYAVAQVDVDEHGNVWAVCSHAYYPNFDFTLQRWDYDPDAPAPYYTFVNEWDISDIIGGDKVISDIVVLERYRRLYISRSPINGWGVQVDCWDISGDDPVYLNSNTFTVSGFYGTNSFQEVHQRFVDMEVDRNDSVLAGCRITVMFMGKPAEFRTLEVKKLDLDLNVVASASIEFNHVYVDDCFGTSRQMWFSNFVLDDMNDNRIVGVYDNFCVPPPGYIGVTDQPTDW